MTLIATALAVAASLWVPVGAAQEEIPADAVAQRFNCDAANQAHNQTSVGTRFASIAVVFRDDQVGCRQVEGILAACKDLASCEKLISMRFVGYHAESLGVSGIQSVVANDTEPTDIILGPSDSGVFVRSVELLEWPEERRVPIISPIVTAAFGADPAASEKPVNSNKAWFFSTNVNAQHRTEVMVNLLNHKNIQAVTVLYSDSEFSRQIEAAIRGKFDTGGAKNYAAYRFQSVSATNDLLDKIVRERPGAIGIIGLRSQIEPIVDSLNTKNISWNTYRPLLFTAIDAQGLGIPNLYYPMLERAAQLELGDVYALSYDTMKMVGTLIIRQSRARNAQFSPVRFQGEFASLLGGQAPEGTASGMIFDKFENIAPLGMRTFDSEGAVPLGQAITAGQELAAQFEARHNRFGPLMLINIGLVVVIVLVLSAIDIQRSYFGNKHSIWFTWPFLLLVLFNITSALIVYTWLAESQQIRWDNTIYALVIALGFSALLKSTLFQTEAGQRIGVQALYDQFVDWLNSRIMVAKHERSAAIIKYVAYRNTLDFLEGRLRSVYGFAESEETREKLMEELDTQIKKIVSDRDGNVLIRQRIVCATKLMKLMSWRKLKQNRIVPTHIKRWEIVNPEHLVDIAASAVLDDDESAAASLRKKVDKLIEDDALVNAERSKRRREELDKALAAAGSSNSDVYLYMRYMFIHFRGKSSKLVAEGLLPENWFKLAPKLPLWRRLLGMKRGRASEDADGKPDEVDENGELRVLRTDGQWSASAIVNKLKGHPVGEAPEKGV